MRRQADPKVYCLIVALATSPTISFAHSGHRHHEPDPAHRHDRAPMLNQKNKGSDILTWMNGISSGQGRLKFQVLYMREHLPQDAVEVLGNAHGGFAVDRREGRGETYFALPGAGIVQLSARLNATRLVDTPEEMKNVNLHNTAIWYDSLGTPFLSFPANEIGKIFTTTIDGELVHTLESPGGDDEFGHPTVNDYFRKGEIFAPTDVEQLQGLFYVTTGYSDLDYVLTAKILSTKPLVAKWHDLVFGGKGSAQGQFGTGHGITVTPGKKRLEVSDRPNSELDRFTRDGHYRSTVELPKGSFPCDIDYAEGYAVVACLHGPDRSKGAPIYILKGDRVLSTIMPKEDLGLDRFQHIHNAVLLQLKGKFYIIAQAWNPGDFVILEQVRR